MPQAHRRDLASTSPGGHGDDDERIVAQPQRRGAIDGPQFAFDDVVIEGPCASWFGGSAAFDAVEGIAVKHPMQERKAIETRQNRRTQIARSGGDDFQSRTMCRTDPVFEQWEEDDKISSDVALVLLQVSTEAFDRHKITVTCTDTIGFLIFCYDPAINQHIYVI